MAPICRFIPKSSGRSAYYSSPSRLDPRPRQIGRPHLTLWFNTGPYDHNPLRSKLLSVTFRARHVNRDDMHARLTKTRKGPEIKSHRCNSRPRPIRRASSSLASQVTPRPGWRWCDVASIDAQHALPPPTGLVGTCDMSTNNPIPETKTSISHPNLAKHIPIRQFLRVPRKRGGYHTTKASVSDPDSGSASRCHECVSTRTRRVSVVSSRANTRDCGIGGAQSPTRRLVYTWQLGRSEYVHRSCGGSVHNPNTKLRLRRAHCPFRQFTRTKDVQGTSSAV